MSVIRTIFMGTPEIARYCLESMLADEHFKIVGVLSQPDRPAGRKMKLQPSPVKELALAQQIEVLTPEKVNQPDILEAIKAWKAEAVVVVAFGQILPQVFLDLFPRRVVNVHASLLPRWRGAAPIQRAIIEGDKKTGVCLQVMVKKLDAGEVVGQRTIDLDDQINSIELHDAMMPLAAELLNVELMDYLRGNLIPVKQDESLVTYATKLDKAESLVDWRSPAQMIHNKLRGLALGPGVYTTRGGKKVKLIKSEYIPLQSKSPPGEVLVVDGDSFIVASGDGALRVRAVQPESRAQMTVKDYLRGYPLQVGERFGE